MKTVLAIILAVALLFAGCSRATEAPELAKPEGVVQSFKEALSRGKVESCLSLVSDDVVFRQDPVGLTFKGKEQIKGLLTLERIQTENLDSYFRTVVDSVSYRKLQSNVPKVILKVKFFNLSVFKWKINSWELILDYNPNDYQVNCKQHPYNLRRQSDRLNTKLGSCQPGNCDIELELDNTVAECIRQAAAERSSVYYQVHITWQLETEDGRIGKHHYLDYLSHSDIPNLSQ